MNFLSPKKASDKRWVISYILLHPLEYPSHLSSDLIAVLLEMIVSVINKEEEERYSFIEEEVMIGRNPTA